VASDGVLARLGRGARRLRGFTVTVVASAAVVTAVALWDADRRSAGDPPVGDVVRVGVGSGQSIPEYVQSSRAELADLVAASGQREVYALVSLSAYLAPDRLTPVLAGVSLAEVYTRVPLPGVQTQLVRMPAYRLPDDVAAGMDEVARRKDAEAADYRRQLAAAGPVDRMREVYRSGAEIAAAEAEAYRGHCSCVYAAVVRASAAALDVIGGLPEVRAVDAAPEVRRLDRSVFLPPLPEQGDLAHPPGPSRPRPALAALAALAARAARPARAPLTDRRPVLSAPPASPTGATR
jgi:hypothetical protein